MNKKTKTKILTLSAVSALSLAAIWVLASNPNDLLFKWAVKQDAHLELSGVTLIAPTQSSNFDVSFKMSWDQLITLTGTNTAGNSVQGNGTLSFWGSNNKTSDPESLILGGSSNEIANTAKENIIGASQWVKTAGESTTNYGKGNVILASSGVNLTGNSNILRAGNNTKIHGNDNLTFATDKVNISANNSIAIGSWIQIDHDGSFVFNGTSKWETTRKANTAIIKASNGMIINANTKTADNTDLTINGSLQVGKSQIDTAGAIISDGCIKLKDISNGEIGLGCRNSSNTDGPFLSFGEVACGRNAKHYDEIDDRQTTWPLGSKNSDFCSKGILDGHTPTFFTPEERAAAYKTRGGSYASEGFGYTFHICFNEQDPTCALPKLKKSWTCSDAKGNRLHCQATQDLGKKDPKQTPINCPSGQHLENGSCVKNIEKCLYEVSIEKKFGIDWPFLTNINICKDKITKKTVQDSFCNTQPASCNSYVCAYRIKSVRGTPKKGPCPPSPRVPGEPDRHERCEWPAPQDKIICVNREGIEVDMSNCKNQPVSCGTRTHMGPPPHPWKPETPPTPVTCPSGKHLENGSCISNTKTVSCDKTWINTANGSVNTSQVAITRSEATKSWSNPAKCDFTCNNGYEKSGNQCVKSRPPRHIVAVKCDANVGDLTYDGWSKSLSTLYSVHDGYYAEFSSIPSQLKLQVYCKYGNLNMSLIHWDMDEKSIRNELGLTDNDNIKIYKCYWNAHRLCNVSYWDPL